MAALRALGLAAIIAVAAWSIACRSGPAEGWSGRARSMILTSGATEIVLSSSKVPGYWARQAGGTDRFFLYTRDRSYEKGSHVTVEGPFGPASPVVFREETGEYRPQVWDPVFVLVVWKMRKEAESRAPSP
ncbi:MAG TPA: hypothetical protein VLJ16_06005 [Acidobacteriota bacterium]|nr:hypothetical protein [Acidobacteriota bacterium]